MKRVQVCPYHRKFVAHRPRLGRVIWVSAFLLLGLVALHGQEQVKAKSATESTVNDMKARLKREIKTIPDLVADGALTQEQANQALTQLKVKLADLYLDERETISTPASSSPNAPPVTNMTVNGERPTQQTQAGAPAGNLPASSSFAPRPAASRNSGNEQQTANEKKKPKEVPDCTDHCYDTRFIAGVEQSGFSAQVNNTNLFVDAFFRDNFHNASGHALWGRIRLLSAPQPSTEGIVSTLVDPTGKITQSGFSQVGQVVDFSAGPEVRIPINWRKTTLSFITAIGATTPLNSKTVVVTYNAPAPNTPECSQLVGRFGQTSGYTPYLVADPAQKTCLYNPITNTAYNFVSFSNQDRSNFLLKWTAGMRLEHDFSQSTDQKKEFGTLDLGFGQDETVTGGKLSGWVFKADGVFPLTLAKSAFYVFGSAAMRTQGNRNLAPLILTVPQAGSTPAIPSTSVVVLPLKQPNRDFYRIGIGLNLLDVLNKLLTRTEESKARSNDNQQPDTDASSGSPGSGKPAGGKKQQ